MEKKIVFLIWIFATFLLASYGYDWQRELGLVPESWPWDLRRWLSQVVWTGLPPYYSFGLSTVGKAWGRNGACSAPYGRLFVLPSSAPYPC